MTAIELDERLVLLLQHRDFFIEGEDEITVEPDDIVLDVIILARVKKPSEVGGSNSGLVIITQNETDNLLISGMLHQAIVAQDQDGYELRKDEDNDE